MAQQYVLICLVLIHPPVATGGWTIGLGPGGSETSLLTKPEARICHAKHFFGVKRAVSGYTKLWT